MGAFRDPSTINNVGAVGSTTNPLTGSALGMDRENQKAIKELIGTLDWESLSILDGGITPVSSEIIVDTEDGTPADDLTTINLTSDGTTSLHTGMRIKIKSADPSRVITVKHLTGGGNIRTADGHDVVLSNDWSLDFKLQNGDWVEQKGRGDATAAEVRVQGAASWSADGAPYPISAQVYHNGKQWLALRANSVEPAAGADWTELVGLFGISPQLMPITGNFNTYLGNFYGTTRGTGSDGIWENCPPCIADNGRLYGGLFLVAGGSAETVDFTKQTYTVWESGTYYGMTFTRTDHRGLGWSPWRTNNDLLESWRSQDGLSWYRKWTDGFIEQGGWLPWKDTYTIVNLFKPYTRVEYQVIATLGQPWGSYLLEIYMENPTADTHTLTTFSMFSRALDKRMYTPPLFWRACGY